MASKECSWNSCFLKTGRQFLGITLLFSMFQTTSISFGAVFTQPFRQRGDVASSQ